MIYLYFIDRSVVNNQMYAPGQVEEFDPIFQESTDDEIAQGHAREATTDERDAFLADLAEAEASSANNNRIILPSGGFEGESLVKASDEDYDFKWWAITQSDVVGLTPADSPTFAGLNVTNFIGFDVPLSNTFAGRFAMSSITTGYDNTALGAFALHSNQSGVQNVALGYAALYSDISGHANVAIGKSALQDLISGNNNMALGDSTGGGITTGSGNTIMGASVSGLPANLTNTVIIASGDGAIKLQVDDTKAIIAKALTLPQLADGAAPVDTIYYSTTGSKLSYKDSGGTVHALY